jgi:putative phosphoribosyl transferase
VNFSSYDLSAHRAAFRDRADAGAVLARSLIDHRGRSDVTVLGLARGGVPVAREVANLLRVPFEVIVARKVGVPGIEEVALGAIAEGSKRVVADTVAWYLGVPSRIVDRLAARERVELERRVVLYGSGLASLDLRGRTVILVDDGVATGATIRAAVRSVREKRPARVIVAVPVASRDSAEDVRLEVDELVTIVTPARFGTVASAYEDYSPVTDEDVLSLMGRATRRVSPYMRDVSDRIGTALTRADGRSRDTERTIGIQTPDTAIVGDLGVPSFVPSVRRGQRAESVRGLVILAHGGGSSRSSYRNRYIAGRLRLSGYATLRLDLLTADEQRLDAAGGSFRFDVRRLAERLTSACGWADREGVAGAHHTVLVGSSTAAAAALEAAARLPGRVFAVAARGGRVDLVADVLPRVRTPVLLMVGGADRESVRRNSDAVDRLPRGAVLLKVPRASRTLEEPGALGYVAEHLVSWLDRLEARERGGDKWHA